jgi:hypothetical protein
MEVAEATAWSGAGRVQEGRHKNTKLIFGVVGVVCIMIVVVVLNMTKKAPPPVTAAPIKGAGLEAESLEKLHDIVTVEKVIIEPPKPAEAPPPEPARGAKNLRGRGPVRGRPQPGRGPAGTTTAATAEAPAEAGGQQAAANNNAFRERSVTPVSGVASRPPPSQADITRVIGNNKIGIKTCYQRALLRDSTLTHGKIVVGVSIGISGRVKSVRVDGPASFRSLEPCIKEMVGRWTFPQASEEYGTEFSYLFQGNE